MSRMKFLAFLGILVLCASVVEASNETSVTIIGTNNAKLAAKLFRTATIKNGRQVVEPKKETVSADFSRSNAISLGKQLKVQDVFWLSLDKMDKTQFVTVRKVNVYSGKMEESNGSFTHSEELLQLVNRLADELAPKPNPRLIRESKK